MAAPTSIVVFSHHGDTNQWPENSVEAIAAAVRLGPGGIEFDVQSSRDGTFWLLHDPTLDTNTTGTGSVRDLRDDELRKVLFDDGPGFDPRKAVSSGLATLAEALGALSQYRGLILVDLKDDATDAHVRLAQELHAAVDPGRVLILVRSIDGARAVKDIDGRFQTFYRNVATWDPAVDGWIADAETEMQWPFTSLADLFGATAAFSEGAIEQSGADLVRHARRWGVSIVITDDVVGATERDRAMSRTRRWWPPVAYPIIIAVALILVLYEASGASPYSSIRLIIGALLVGMAFTIACSAVLRDRDRGALLALLGVLGLYAGLDDPRLVIVLAAAAVLLLIETVSADHRVLRTPWRTISRMAIVIAVIIVLAIGIKAVQDGTAQAVVADVRAEGPAILRPALPPAAVAAHADDPDIFVVLLDGYLRPDKQKALFGHDDSAFIDALEARGFRRRRP